MADPFVSRTGGLSAAINDLQLSQKEQALYKMHLDNLWGPGGVTNPDGSRSTIFNITTEINGKNYVLPTVWGGKILKPDAAIERAKSYGLDKFPSYATGQEAEDRYNAIHAYMEKDVKQWQEQQSGRGGVSPLGGQAK